MLNLEEKLLAIVKNETIPAVGCTEPIAVAFAAAVAKKYSKGDLEKLSVHTSKGIFKNGKSVKIPNTNLAGLDLAAGVGFLAGNPDKELLVLDSVSKDNFKLAEKLLDEGRVGVDFLEESPDIYVEIIAENKENDIHIILKDSHNHIEKIIVDGELVHHEPINLTSGGDEFIRDLSFIEIQKFIEDIPLDKILFIKEGIDMNIAAAEKGLNTGLGLKLGKTLNDMGEENLIAMDSPTRARILTASAADIRMGGDVCPIMTSAGSGNQGLGVILPISVIAEDHNLGEEKLLRAVLFAHIINKYVKLYTGKLSYMCGCGIAAGVGSSAAISWMLGGNSDQIAGACNNMLANIAGMFCDGAKESCAFKLSTSAAESILAAYLANQNIITQPNTGIVGEGIESTIQNIGSLCQIGNPYMDPAIIDIINR